MEYYLRVRRYLNQSFFMAIPKLYPISMIQIIVQRISNDSKKQLNVLTQSFWYGNNLDSTTYSLSSI